MTYTEAVDLAKKTWGEKAFAHVNTQPFIKMVGEVTVSKGEPAYFIYGEGKTWEAAFEAAMKRNLN